jgi:ABC-2 type transport system ATP-binding protein
VNEPDVLILDEPLTGLDPVQRNRMIKLFHELGLAGTCVLVSSHVLDEVARLGSNVLVIAQGRLAATGDYRALRDLMDDRPRRVRIATDEPRRLGAALIERSLVDGISVGSESVLVDTSDIDLFGRNVVFRYLVERR